MKIRPAAASDRDALAEIGVKLAGFVQAGLRSIRAHQALGFEIADRIVVFRKNL